MGSSVITAGLMTVVAQAAPTKNYDAQTSSMIRKGSGTPGVCSWLLYYARPFPVGATILSAQLVMYSAATAQTGTLTLTAKRVKTSVNFSKVTYNTRPTTFFSGTATATRTGPVTAKSQWTFDITTMMQSVSAGDPWYGFEISSSVLTPGLYFYGPTYSDPTLVPRLEIVYSDSPDQPRTLSPAGGRAISSAKPTLRCDYVDISGSTQIAGMQVQTSATNSFTSPAFDSGDVAVSTPELDLSLTAFTALTDGQSVWWRVRVKDGAGLWSDWSDGANFVRDIKGTLTLTNPSSGSPFVSEATPPITWTFTGETQESYQILIYQIGTAGAWIYDSGRITSTVTTHTLPEGVLTSPDDAYYLELRVWDTKDREGVAGDEAYVWTTRNFTFNLSATVATVTALTSTWQSPYPKVSVSWTRSTAPDSYTILRDREVIATDLDPGALLVSGTSYTFVDLSASPQSPHTYEVIAVVNGVSSASNPTTTITFTSQGVWLADIDRVDEVLITGKTDRNFVWGESSEALEVVGSTQVVLVTQSLRGAEGQITGQLHSGLVGLTTTAQQWRDRLLRLKAKAGQRLWLTVGDQTMQVVMRNVSISPRPVATLSFDVSFDFYQVGTLQFTPAL